MVDGSTDRAAWWLTVLLRVGAAILTSAAFAAFLPFEWMAATHVWLGMGELPDRPIVGYLTRSLSAVYAIHGAMLLAISMDVRRYAPLIRVVAWLNVAFGAYMLGLDLVVGMPWWWTAAEGPWVAAVGGVLLWLLRKLDTTS